MAIVTTTEKGQIVIPADIRRRHRIAKGTRLSVIDRGDEIIIRPLLRDPVRQARGFFKEGGSALQVLISDREEETSR